MSKILWISLCAPYSKVNHAGGQMLCHMYEYIISKKKYEIRFASLYRNFERDNIHSSLLCEDTKLALESESIFMKLINLESRINFWNRYGGYLSNSRALAIKKAIKEIHVSEYKPDLVFLHWTEISMLVDYVKSLFPGVSIVCIEEDVAFLKRERRYLTKKNFFMYICHYLRYRNSKSKELSCLSRADLVVVNNLKDKDILIKRGINKNKIEDCCVYFSDMKEIKNKRKNNDIIFWGAMWRKENYDSAIWFIQNVMPLLKDLDIRFVVIGSNPPPQLMKYECKNIVVTGFVDNPESYFSESMCMVVPLIIGAGIKVKVLEALSAGIPVVANSIGIEGIPAEDQRDFFYAETPYDYQKAINNIISMNENERNILAVNARNIIDFYFKFDDKMSILWERVDRLLQIT